MKSEALSRFLRKLQIRTRKSSKASTISQSEGNSFLHSVPVENVHPKPTNAFTTMPCRVHQQDNIAVAAAQRVTGELATMMNESMGSAVAISSSPIGHLISLSVPECLPRRLEVAASFSESGCLLDGM